MGSTILNQKYLLSYTDEFKMLDGDELKQLNFLNEGAGICLRNEERHIMITAAWKQVGGFTSMMLNDKDLVKNAEEYIRKANKAYQYHYDGPVQLEAAGQKAEGFQYGYHVQDTDMTGICCVIKDGKTVYYFYLYVRKENEEEGIQIFRQMLENITTV
ncbi:MAG: hypothetical protein IKR11_06120 [Solobacterium sp.]|nr:hypothetical protein [Solobacterium sp.]